jgi:hypothetical protein
MGMDTDVGKQVELTQDAMWPLKTAMNFLWDMLLRAGIYQYINWDNYSRYSYIVKNRVHLIRQNKYI